MQPSGCLAGLKGREMHLRRRWLTPKEAPRSAKEPSVGGFGAAKPLKLLTRDAACQSSFDQRPQSFLQLLHEDVECSTHIPKSLQQERLSAQHMMPLAEWQHLLCHMTTWLIMDQTST